MTHKIVGLLATAMVMFLLRDMLVSNDMIWVGSCILLAGFMSGGEYRK